MPDLPAIITPELIAYIRSTYQLRWNGLHGWDHWVRVYENGMALARLNGADQDVVALFAFTHDMARLNDGTDPEHGPRAARRIETELHGVYIHLGPQPVQWLRQAVAGHTLGQTDPRLTDPIGSLTVQTCWDSDRLDLGRAGIVPVARRLCTPQARDPEVIAWAYQRSLERLGK
jgi:uncharacterized protein